MRHRLLWIYAWVTALLIFNVAHHWKQNAGKNATYIFLEAIGEMTGPVEFLTSAVVLSGIAFSSRKPMAER